MSLSRPLQSEYMVVLCDLCEEEHQVKWKCLACDILICSRCCKIHEKLKSAEGHNTVDVNDIAVKPAESGPRVEPDFNGIKCNEHQGHSCCLFCRDCEERVCPLCIAHTHNRHGMIELKEQYNSRRGTITNWLPKLDEEETRRENDMAIVQSIRTAEIRTYETQKDNILNQEKALKQAVSTQAEKLLNDLEEKWFSVQKSLSENETNVKLRKQDIMEMRAGLVRLLQLNDVGELFRSFKEHSKFFERETIKVNYQQLPEFVKGEIVPEKIEDIYGMLKYNPGQCTEQLIQKIEFEVVEHYGTTCPAIQSVACCRDGSLWIKDRQFRKLQNVQISADGFRFNKSYDLMVYDLALTPTGDLLLSTLKPELRIIPCSTGQNEISHFDVSPLYTSAVCAAWDDKVVVGAVQSGPDEIRGGIHSVIVMDSEGNHESTYHLGKDGLPLFTFPHRVTVDTNYNIYVIDHFNTDSDGRVVILGQNEEIRGIYNGCKDVKFNPCNLVTMSSNKVIVSDCDNAMLHFIDSEGQCISTKNTRDLGIVRPLALDFDSRGLLFVGSNDCIKSDEYIYSRSGFGRESHARYGFGNNSYNNYYGGFGNNSYNNYYGDYHNKANIYVVKISEI